MDHYMHLISYRSVTILICVAFCIRAIVMLSVIQPYGFYRQADSGDYHNCALSIAHGSGMHRLDTREPIFWRTPGYPLYLACFYSLCGIPSYTFDDQTRAQRVALWLQLLLSSFIPLLLLYLASAMTHNRILAISTAWITALHPGLVLASTYLLTEGIALIFFYLFLLLFYRTCLNTSFNYRILIAAAFSLSLYTWMRPMGEFIGYATAFFIAVASRGLWKTTIKKALLFLTFFTITLVPWYWRNHTLTGEWFFCPTIGNYVNCFSVPKILRRTLHKPLLECHKIAQHTAARHAYHRRLALQGTGLYVSPNVSKAAAFPIIAAHPWYFITDWTQEVLKTTFDLYMYQIIPMLDDTYWYDPLEEWLPEKITQSLITHPMPWYARFICWLEFLIMILLWIGLIGGAWRFVMQLLYERHTTYNFIMHVWLLTIPMIGIILGMTGGFGYARLRLPAEPLLIILSLTFWFSRMTKGKK